jgi:undecaprenyl-diphosphatase
MSEPNIFSALILGLIEGLTEFIPVSSTAHVQLASHFLKFESPSNAFTILVQLGAILAILLVYFKRLLDVALTLRSSERSRYFVLSILLAFLPAVVVGVFAESYINELLERPAIMCYVLIIGGIVLLAVDRLRLQPRYFDAMAYPLPLALKIGICQCVAMIPGTSRSGATIVGALLMGADKRSAAEFSFFLAIPTMAGAFAYDLYKNHSLMTADNITLVVIGFLTSFVTAFFVVKLLLDYVTRHGFALFAWWRVLVGTLGLIGLAMGY